MKAALLKELEKIRNRERIVERYLTMQMLNRGKGEKNDK